MAALGGSLPLNPPTALYEVTQDHVDQAERQLKRFLDELAEIIREHEYERGMGSSAASYYAANAVRHFCDDWHHDFVTQN
jgi:homoserine kinase